MRERLRLWLNTLITNKYYIIRNKLIPWKFYYQNYTVNKYALGEDQKLKGFHFGSSSDNGSTYNAVSSYLILKLLTLLYKEKFRYRRFQIKENIENDDEIVN